MAYVDWCDAYAYCEGVGKRLCGNRAGGPNSFGDYANASASQWYNACVSGAADNTYPYGDTYGATLCDGYQYSAAVTEAGTIETCQSPEEGYTGVYDLSGNVLEWEDSCDAQRDQSYNCRLRGGGFWSMYNTMPCAYSYDFHGRDIRGYLVGFRCCAP